MLDGTYYFECDCGADEHTLRFTLCKDEDDLCIYTSIYLNGWHPWWKRIWMATRYVFGYKSRYGHWDCWMMRADDADRLKSMIEDFNRTNKETS